MTRFPDSDLFEYRGDFSSIGAHPIILRETDNGERPSTHDPYCFLPLLNPAAMRSFQDGHHYAAQNLLGAHLQRVDGVDGTLFAVWAPGASRVSVVGDFNAWDGRRHPMRFHALEGIWELFIPGRAQGTYKLAERFLRPAAIDPQK